VESEPAINCDSSPGSGAARYHLTVSHQGGARVLGMCQLSRRAPDGCRESSFITRHGRSALTRRAVHRVWTCSHVSFYLCIKSDGLPRSIPFPGCGVSLAGANGGPDGATNLQWLHSLAFKRRPQLEELPDMCVENSLDV
jgi:hypothetical protein